MPKPIFEHCYYERFLFWIKKSSASAYCNNKKKLSTSILFEYKDPIFTPRLHVYRAQSTFIWWIFVAAVRTSSAILSILFAIAAQVAAQITRHLWMQTRFFFLRIIMCAAHQRVYKCWPQMYKEKYLPPELRLRTYLLVGLSLEFIYILEVNCGFWYIYTRLKWS